jgi:hypothetical protein
LSVQLDARLGERGELTYVLAMPLVV